MSRSELARDLLPQLVTDTIRTDDFRKATFGGAVRGKALPAWVRVVIRPVVLRGDRYLQFSYFDAKKNIIKNVRGNQIGPRVREILDHGFAAIHLVSRTKEMDLRTTKKGKVLIGCREVDTSIAETDESHNRVKNVPLPEGRADRVLEVMGILTGAGHVRSTMRAKYTQINEFLKLLAHVLDVAQMKSLGRPVQILDCGCGSSYLTLAVHHYLNDVLAIPAQIQGVDVNEEVIRKSVERSEKLGVNGLSFVCGPIGASAGSPDIVLTLHACDTATDDAIARAVKAQARILLSVPCCHHHLNAQIRSDGPARVLRPILRHGILQQRTADLVTDAFRALALRIMGYRTDVIEFISPEHTARNLMIRAVHGAPVGDVELVHEYVQMRDFWGVSPYIEQSLGQPFQHILSSAQKPGE